jgi:hypothetical protein
MKGYLKSYRKSTAILKILKYKSYFSGQRVFGKHGISKQKDNVSNYLLTIHCVYVNDMTYMKITKHMKSCL